MPLERWGDQPGTPLSPSQSPLPPGFFSRHTGFSEKSLDNGGKFQTLSSAEQGVFPSHPP